MSETAAAVAAVLVLSLLGLSWMALLFERQHGWEGEVSWGGSQGCWVGNKPYPAHRYSLGTHSALKVLLTWIVGVIAKRVGAPQTSHN